MTMANVIQLGENESVRALQRFVVLRNKYKGDIDKVARVMGQAQYNLAEGELISRAGDPDRFDEKTGNWIIWP
jgi:hypothetical protein